MLCGDPGVLPPSDYYFATPSATAKSLFYFLLSIGDFTCGAGYHVARKSYNSLLLLYVLEGECTVCCEGKTHTAQAGDMVFLNCYRPHEYFTSSHLRCVWLHFDGGQSLDFFEHNAKNRGVVFPCENPAAFLEACESLLTVLRGGQGLSEPSVSVLLYRALCNLVASTSPSGALELTSEPIAKAAEYARAHLAEPLTVERLARVAALSPTHFSRLFKRQTGYAPHEFIIKARLDAAKKLLKNTNLPISDVARRAGFSGVSGFISSFHKQVGIAPSQFRKMPF